MDEIDGRTVAVFLLDEEERDKDWRRVMGTLRVTGGRVFVEDTDAGPSFPVPPDLLEQLGPIDEETREVAFGAEYLLFFPRHRYLGEELQ
jgi:hypothetical protein